MASSSWMILGIALALGAVLLGLALRTEEQRREATSEQIQDRVVKHVEQLYEEPASKR